MEKFLKLISCTFFILFIISCSNDDPDVQPESIDNDSIAIVNDESKIVKAELINSSDNLYIIDVTLTNKRTNKVLSTIRHTFVPEDKNKTISDLPKRFK